MRVSRRSLLGAATALLGGAAAAVGKASAATQAWARDRAYSTQRHWHSTYSGGPVGRDPLPPGRPGRDYNPVTVPDGAAVDFQIVDGVKVFHLNVGPIRHQVLEGLEATFWGVNGRLNSSVIEAVEGDRVRIYVTNNLSAPTSIHWHGMYLPNGMDGVSGVTQPAIPPGETFVYEFTLLQHGTFMYHSHHDTMTQEGMGLFGMFVVHPRDPDPDWEVDRDFALMLGEYRIPAGADRPDPNEMTDFNVLTINGKSYPGTSPLVAKTGQRVRIRIGNLSQMHHHPIHLHGYHWKETAHDGITIPPDAQPAGNTVLVGVGQTRTVEFIADAPGDWAMHCHMTHHIMNQMGHGGPNMVGVESQGLDEAIRDQVPKYMTMGENGMGAMGGMKQPENAAAMVSGTGQYGPLTFGGMFTMVKVRDELDSYEDPGGYPHPEGTVARPATRAELDRDGISRS